MSAPNELSAEQIRDWSLAGCDHTLPMDEGRTCAPCLRDLFAEWLDQRTVDRSRLRDLADWHETKAEKARRFPGPLERNEDVMRGKAEVHKDAARRLRELAEVSS